MSRPPTNQELQGEILRSLRKCGDYLLPQERLIEEVRLAYPDVLIKEILDALQIVEGHRWAIPDRHNILGIRWVISSAGKLALET